MWNEMQADGTLTRLDTAFSRDQANKIYVQDRIRENAEELYAWLERGAYFYVCGDAIRMAKDVEQALLDAIAKASNGSLDRAAEYLAAMKQQKRYRRDIYQGRRVIQPWARSAHTPSSPVLRKDREGWSTCIPSFVKT